jgi:hypothetical protein
MEAKEKEALGNEAVTLDKKRDSSHQLSRAVLNGAACK